MPGTAAAIGVSALVSYYATNRQADAAETASQQQVDASKNALNAVQANFDKSFNFAQQKYNQSRADMAPWLSYGRGAVSMLGDLMGVKPDQSPTVEGGPGSGLSDVFTHGALDGTPSNQGGARAIVGGSRDPNTSQPPGPPITLSGPANPGAGPGGIHTTATGGPAQAGQPGAAGQTGTARIVWPDGSRNEVNAAQLPQYIQLGAKVAP